MGLCIKYLIDMVLQLIFNTIIYMFMIETITLTYLYRFYLSLLSKYVKQ